MATSAFERPAQRSLLLPPIRALPTPRRATGHAPDVVDDFSRRGRSWFGHPQDLPGRVTGALWTILLGAAVLAGWLIAATPSTGLFYRIATLGHPRLLLVLAVASAATLLLLAPFTHGLSRAGGPELGVMVVAGVAGSGALLGVVALGLLTALAAFLTLAAVIAVFEHD
jgi:hypothetical protein